MNRSHVLSILAILALATVAVAQAPAGDKASAAEAALKNCELEKSLRLWREVLAANPNHPRAKFVVERLTAQVLDLDSHLAVLETLIDKGVTGGTESLLDAAVRQHEARARSGAILRRARRRRIKLPPGSPTAEELIREDRER